MSGLEATIAAASACLDAKDHAGAIALLEPALRDHPRQPGEDPDRALRDLLRVGFTDLGVAHHSLGDDAAATAAYRAAAAWGSKVACGNLVTLAVDAKQWTEARARLDELATFYLTAEERGAFARHAVRVSIELGDREAARAAAAAHAEFLRELAKQKRDEALALQAAFLASAPADLHDAVAAAIPPPAPVADIDAGDIALAVRLARAGKVAQLRSLLGRLPALATAPDVLAAVAEAPDAIKQLF